MKISEDVMLGIAKHHLPAIKALGWDIHASENSVSISMGAGREVIVWTTRYPDLGETAAYDQQKALEQIERPLKALAELYRAARDVGYAKGLEEGKVNALAEVVAPIARAWRNAK